MSDHPAIAFTQERSFCSPYDEPVQSVKAGLPVSDVLEHASTLLGHTSRLVMDDSEENRTAAHYLLENAKALVDAALAGIWDKEKEAYAASKKNGADV